MCYNFTLKGTNKIQTNTNKLATQYFAIFAIGKDNINNHRLVAKC